MKKIICICLLVISYSCINETKRNNKIEDLTSNERQHKYIYIYESDSVNFKALFFNKKGNSIKFDLEVVNNSGNNKVSDFAQLVLLEDDNGALYVPEGTPVIDERTNKEYFCDSTYDYNNDKVSFSFSFEKGTKNRLSLVIYNSKISNFLNGEYTMYKK